MTTKLQKLQERIDAFEMQTTKKMHEYFDDVYEPATLSYAKQYHVLEAIEHEITEARNDQSHCEDFETGDVIPSKADEHAAYEKKMADLKQLALDIEDFAKNDIASDGVHQMSKEDENFEAVRAELHDLYTQAEDAVWQYRAVTNPSGFEDEQERDEAYGYQSASGEYQADGELTEYYHFDQVKELTAKIARTEYALGTKYDLELPHIIGAEIEKTSQQTVEATRAAAQPM